MVDENVAELDLAGDFDGIIAIENTGGSDSNDGNEPVSYGIIGTSISVIKENRTKRM